MKTESSGFATARLNRHGKQPILLFRFSSPAFKASTVKVTTTESGNPTYEPLVLSVDSAQFAMESFGHFASLSTLIVTLARNQTTDLLVSAAAYGQQPVEIDVCFFLDAGVAVADLVPVARMVVGSVVRATQEEIDIELTNDERKLFRIPKNKVSGTSLVVPKDSKLMPLPILIGDFRRADGGTSSVDEPYHTRFGDYVPLLLADEVFLEAHTYSGLSKKDIGKWVLSENDVGNGTDPTVNEVFEFQSGFDMHIKVGSVDGSNNDAQTWRSDNPQSEPYVASGLYVARVRMTSDRNMFRLGEGNGAENELDDTSGSTSYIWKNACDDDQANYAELRLGQTPARTKLAISFTKRGQPAFSLPTKFYYFFTVTDAEKSAGGGTRLKLVDAFIIHPSDPAKNGVYLVDSAAFVQDITGSTTLPQTFFFGPLNGIGPITQEPVSKLGWNFENLMMKLTISGVTSSAGQFAKIKSFGVEAVYADDQSSFKSGQRIFPIGYEGEVRRGIPFWDEPRFVRTGRVVRQVRDINLAARKNIFADVTGPRSFAASSSNPDGFIFTHPVFVVAALLCDVLGYSYSEIDGPGFRRVQNFYLNSEMSFFLQNESDAVEVLTAVCQQANFLLFRSSSGVWKLMPRNAYLEYSLSTTYSAPVTAFGDQKTDYVAMDLEVHKIEPIHNKFTVQYAFDWARNLFASESINDYSGTFTNGRPMAPVEANFIRKATPAAELATALRDYYGKPHREITFRSTGTAAILEVGDYLTMEHAALPVQSPLPKYQVTSVKYDADNVQITALEVTG